MRRCLRFLVPVALVAVLFAAPAAAYTIYLKDGSRIVATEKYSVDGDRALIKLPNGNVTTIKASEIDVPRTEAANTTKLGNAVVLEGSEIRDTPSPPPAAAPELKDLIAAGQVQPRALPEAKRVAPTVEAAGPSGKTPGGVVDYATLPHTPLPIETSAAIEKVFYEHGLRELSSWRGSKPDRLLIQVTVTSEASTFKAIAVVAKLLDSFHKENRTDVNAVELLMPASQGGRAGQFLLTADQAEAMLNNQLEISAYYVQNLQF
jgi:hypothetical protein